MTTQKFKCPICGYRFLADPEGMYASGQVSVTRKADRQLHAAVARTIDLNCPYCKNDFEVKIGA